MGSTRIKYMDLPAPSSRSLSPSSVSSNSDLGFFSKKVNSTNSHCYGDFIQSFEDLSNSNYSSDSCLSGTGDATKVINVDEDLTILADHYYRTKAKKQRNSETVTFECVDIGLSAEQKKNLQKRNKSLSSISRLLKNFSLTKSSKSLTNSPLKEKKKKEEPPKTILRRPVEYVYVKGMSGLATQRVPRKSICCQYS